MLLYRYRLESADQRVQIGSSVGTTSIHSLSRGAPEFASQKLKIPCRMGRSFTKKHPHLVMSVLTCVSEDT